MARPGLCLVVILLADVRALLPISVPLSRALTVRRRVRMMSEDIDIDVQTSVTEADPVPSMGSRLWRTRIANSYREGVQKGQRYFKTGRAADAIQEAGAPLRSSDKFAASVLCVALCEVGCIGAALVISWLVCPFSATATPGAQARLTAAALSASTFRARTRLPRLLLELVTLPAAWSALARRPIEDRPTLVYDRLSQAVGVLVAAALTMRAINQGWLAGTSGPAAAVLGVKFSALVSPVTDMAVLMPLRAAVTSAASTAWAALLTLCGTIGSLEASARATPLLQPLFALCDLERHLLQPSQFVTAALRAFFDEVVAPLLRTLGFLTMQTLG